MAKVLSGWLGWLQRKSRTRAPDSAGEQHARRLEALWQIASMPRSDGATRQLAMLKSGADALRPGQVFYGQLTRLDADEIVIIDGGGGTERTDEFAPPQMRIAKGLRYPIDQGPQADVLAIGTTIGWPDIRTVPIVCDRRRTLEFAARAVVGTRFLVAGKTHFLMFYSGQAASAPFTPEDYAYVDVLASFFASHLHEGNEVATEMRVAQNARRLSALWEIARAPQLDDRARLVAMLESGGRALSPGYEFYGQLSYQDGDEIVLIAGGKVGRDGRPVTPGTLTGPGVRFPIEDGIHADVLAAARTIGWADALIPSLAKRKRVAEFGTRAIIGTTFMVGDRRHFLMYFAFEPFGQQFGHDDYAFVDVLASFFASQLQRGVGRATEIQLAQNVHRSAALREIAAVSPRLDDKARLLAMLGACANALRPGQPFTGQLSYLDGENIVIIAGTRLPDSHAGLLLQPVINDEGEYLLADSTQAEVLAAGSTIGWDDALNVPALQSRSRVRIFGWRALIGTTFKVAGRTHFLLFGSAQPTAEPFTQEDCAYVDVLASFFASRLQHGVQRDRIREQLEIDTLTGLPNRTTFRSAAMRTMSDGACAMIVIDVDGWRRIIEVHGHQTADALLVELAVTFGTLAGPGEPVARLTGDTFAMLVQVADIPALHERVRNFVATLSRPYSIGDRFGREHVSLTVCAGLALAQPGSTFELLFRNAEAALSAAKQAGAGSMAAFDDVMEASHAQRQLVRLELPHAVACGQLNVIYQPMIVLSTMRVCGADALVRWNHPEHGVIRAADFLPFAWENGVKADIGRLVMNAVTAALPVLSDDPAFRAYMNVSAQELADPVFLRDLCELVKKQHAGRLGVEIAESVVMRDAQSAIAVLEELKGDGLAISMDDFGTGRASIADLKKVPLDAIKIDGSLIRGLPHDRDSILIVEALLKVAQTFGYTTIAKNVENPEQLAWLTAHGCTMAQGYHVAHPMSAPAFRAWTATVREGPAVA